MTHRLVRHDTVRMGQKFAPLGGCLVSRLGFGCMSLGSNMKQGVGRHQWTLNDGEEAFELMKTAVDAGINFFDTANVYSSGDCEVVTGRFLKMLYNRRSQYVLATKVGLPMTDLPTEFGTSRKHIMESIDASLERLDLDYVDLLIIHRLDSHTPPEETMKALHDVVQSGKALYIGASSMYAWEFARLQHIAKINNWTPFVSMQNHYNLLYREEEREMMPMLSDQNILCTPWSPLARGVLARPLDKQNKTKRARTDPMMSLFDLSRPDNVEILNALGRIAKHHDVSQSAVALAWLMEKGCVPIVGATSKTQFQQSLDALELRLTSDEINSLELPYTPKPHGVGIGRDAKAWCSK